MQLNTLKPNPGSKKPRLRVGRGASAGQGKTCGRGVKGQRARKGGYHKVGFEGGQMPLQRRLPKVGFRSKIKSTRAEVRLSELAKVDADGDRSRGSEEGRRGAGVRGAGEARSVGRSERRLSRSRASAPRRARALPSKRLAASSPRSLTVRVNRI